MNTERTADALTSSSAAFDSDAFHATKSILRSERIEAYESASNGLRSVTIQWYFSFS